MGGKFPQFTIVQFAKPFTPLWAWRCPRLLSRIGLESSPARRSHPPGRRAASNGQLRSSILIATALLAGGTGCVLFAQGIYIHLKAIVAQVLLERAFVQSVETGQAVKPWSWADTWPVARVSVPRLMAQAIVLEGSSGQALAFGPGRLPGSAVAGEPGTAVYAAHRDTHFAFIGQVVVGDRLMVTRDDGREITFDVTGTSIVSWDNSGIDVYASGRNLVLATCWPLDARTAGPLRYLVHAAVVDRDEETQRVAD